MVVSERTVARYLRRMRRRGDPSKSWLTFLQNHREAMAAFDFFTVPTATFQLLYCFFVIAHGRRILHFNVTAHPTAEPGGTGLKAKRTSLQAPWQNGIAERWVGTARRDCFDHLIAQNEAHARRLGRELLAYYHEDGTHLGLDKDTPAERPIGAKADRAELESLARVGG